MKLWPVLAVVPFMRRSPTNGGQRTAIPVSVGGEPDQQSCVRVLGVCGGIGSGKSQACQLLVSELGCISHIEADSIAHSVYKPGGQAVKDVVEKFGSEVLAADKEDEEIDRKKLGAIVFSDPSALSTLEGIVWPHVKAEIRSRIDEIKQQQQGKDNKQLAVVVLEAAVLLDAGFDDIVDGVWVIRVPDVVAVERLVKYRSFTREDATNRIHAQKTRRGIGNVEEEMEHGIVTAVIENMGGLNDLKAALLEKLNDSKAWNPRLQQ